MQPMETPKWCLSITSSCPIYTHTHVGLAGAGIFGFFFPFSYYCCLGQPKTMFKVCALTKTLLTGVLVQFPAWIAAGLRESVLTDTLAGGLLQNPVGPAESQQTWVQHLWKTHSKMRKAVYSKFSFFLSQLYATLPNHCPQRMKYLQWPLVSLRGEYLYRNIFTII